MKKLLILLVVYFYAFQCFAQSPSAYFVSESKKRDVISRNEDESKRDRNFIYGVCFHDYDKNTQQYRNCVKYRSERLDRLNSRLQNFE